MKLHHMVLYNLPSTNFLELKIVWTKCLTILSYTYLNYFVSEIGFWKILKNMKKQYILSVCFGRKYILRSANELPRNISRWSQQKNALELYDWHQGRQCRMPTWNLRAVYLWTFAEIRWSLWSNLDVSAKNRKLQLFWSHGYIFFDLRLNYRLPFHVPLSQKAETLYA